MLLVLWEARFAEHLSPVGEAHDSRGEVDGQSCDVVGAAFDSPVRTPLGGVKTLVVCVGDHALRAAHALGWAGEQRQHAVTGRLDNQDRERGTPRAVRHLDGEAWLPANTRTPIHSHLSE